MMASHLTICRPVVVIAVHLPAVVDSAGDMRVLPLALLKDCHCQRLALKNLTSVLS